MATRFLIGLALAIGLLAGVLAPAPHLIKRSTLMDLGEVAQAGSNT